MPPERCWFKEYRDPSMNPSRSLTELAPMATVFPLSRNSCSPRAMTAVTMVSAPGPMRSDVIVGFDPVNSVQTAGLADSPVSRAFRPPLELESNT